MVYDYSGSSLEAVYLLSGTQYNHAYDIEGTDLLDGAEPEEPFVKTTLSYDMNWLINAAWLANAEIQREAIKAIYLQSEDAIPFFIQTDGHGRLNEGNKGCHNLAEPIMRYIPNLQLGDYASYYSDGANASNHVVSSEGITNYIPAMGNHEFMKNSSEAQLPSLPVLVASFTSPDGILGSQTYGYYKVLDDKYHVKYLVGQPHIPDADNSSGFISKFTSDQWEWFIDELEANDGYDVIVLNHEPFGGTYTRYSDGTTSTYAAAGYNLSPVLAARKAKTSGSVTDADGNIHSYDFSACTTDLICCMHGHTHRIEYSEKAQYGYPVIIGRDMTNNGDCLYGIIDRTGGYMYAYPFGRDTANERIVLAL